MKSIIPLLLFLWVSFANSASDVADDKIKVACIGNSVTFGYGFADPANDSYPSQLGRLLGTPYEVRNFGRSGATLLSRGHNPYVGTEQYRQALEFKPDIVIIDLGLNETDPRNWPNYGDEFISDYHGLIKSFQTDSGEEPEVYVCLMTPIFPGHSRFKSGTRDWFWEIQESIRKVALHSGAHLIDLHTPLYRRPDLFADFLHPNEEGAGIIASTVFGAITGDFGGFGMPPFFGEHMVFQQGEPVVWYGKSNKGDTVEIYFDRQYKQVITPDNGQWIAEFPEVRAGGPYSLEIRVNGLAMVDWNDILCGEVWICSGQSNMAFELKYAKGGSDMAKRAGDEGLRLMNYQGFIQTNDVAFDSLALVRLNRLDFFEGQWQKDMPGQASEFSAIGYFFGAELRDKLKVPVGLIQVAVGGAPIEAFIDRKTLELNPVLVEQFLNREKNDFIFDWVRQRITRNISLNNHKNQRHPYDPAYIFEAGIAPMTNFPVRGVLWYQGESNAHNADLYEIAFHAWVDSWRRNWNNPEMPVLVAQLSGIDRPSWPRFREIQRQLVNEIPKTGLVVTFDKGDSLDVHPIQKQEVGERFALQALDKVYHKKVTSDGPVYRKIIRKDTSTEILFYTDGGLGTSDSGAVRELEAASEDGIFREVPATIKGKKLVIPIPGNKVSAVRYGWKPYSRANLVNMQGLPAAPFVIFQNIGEP